jgi:hypothetical protein
MLTCHVAAESLTENLGLSGFVRVAVRRVHGQEAESRSLTVFLFRRIFLPRSLYSRQDPNA